MKRIYVTEGGYFNKYGHFCGTGIIGVDSNPKLAVSFPIQQGSYRHEVIKDVLDLIVIYKSSFSDRGYRITCVDAF